MLGQERIISIPAYPLEVDDILFIADLEYFSRETKNEIISRILKEKKKLVVFVGDILSGLNNQLFPIIAYEDSMEAMSFFMGRMS